ncbi:MAG: sigma-70 family RNA polymerase sigma factor [Akkermansiaceae bacterium]|jgi:RNA polymerase sigma-70 factor (ECF subfamily)|nr:sigma-70 family RNA polymerase sigma factor [Akkermansiaceae bacterium]
MKQDSDRREREEGERGAQTLVQGLFLRHIDLIRGFIRGMLRDRSLVDDVLHETFLTVVSKAEAFEPGTSFPKWACTIARFKVFEVVKRESGKLRFFSDETLELLAESHEAETEDRRIRYVGECVAELPPKMRQLVELRYAGERKPAEIARVVGWSIDAVYVALSRARVAIRDCINDKAAKYEIS